MVQEQRIASSIGRLVRQWSLAGNPLRSMATSTVYDHLVHIKVIDGEGHRHSFTGIEGQTLAELIREHSDVLGPQGTVLCIHVQSGTIYYVYCLINGAAVADSPEGRGRVEAHVKIPTELFDAIPAPRGDDEQWMKEVADPYALDEHSRLGSRIVLDKSMDGVIVSIGDIYPYKTL